MPVKSNRRFRIESVNPLKDMPIGHEWYEAQSVLLQNGTEESFNVKGTYNGMGFSPLYTAEASLRKKLAGDYTEFLYAVGERIKESK